MVLSEPQMKMILLYLFLYVTSVAMALTDLRVQLKNIPYDANIPMLCNRVVSLYFTDPPTNVTKYCLTDFTKRMDHLEILEVIFPNVTTAKIALDAYPTALNMALTSDGFFSLWPGGEVSLVVYPLNLANHMYIILGCFLGVTMIYLGALWCFAVR